MKKIPGCLGYIGNEILPSNMGSLISQYKPANQYNGMSAKGFERCSAVVKQFFLENKQKIHGSHVLTTFSYPYHPWDERSSYLLGMVEF